MFENFVSDPNKKINLNNDNDEQLRLFESCTIKGKPICNPIVDWQDSDVWDYIRSERLSVNPLYDMGFYLGGGGGPWLGRTVGRSFGCFLPISGYIYGRFESGDLECSDQIAI